MLQPFTVLAHVLSRLGLMSLRVTVSVRAPVLSMPLALILPVFLCLGLPVLVGAQLRARPANHLMASSCLDHAPVGSSERMAAAAGVTDSLPRVNGVVLIASKSDQVSRIAAPAIHAGVVDFIIAMQWPGEHDVRQSVDCDVAAPGRGDLRVSASGHRSVPLPASGLLNRVNPWLKEAKQLIGTRQVRSGHTQSFVLCTSHHITISAV